MNMHLSGIIQRYLVAFGVLLACYSCTNDAWDEHYGSNQNVKTTETLWDQLLKEDTLSQFRQLLDSVHITNGNKITSATYADMLKKQYFTVFAPVNGSFNLDSLLSLRNTIEGYKKLEQRFIMSHLSRTPHSLSPYTNKMALMMNGKYLVFRDSALSLVPLITNKSNIVAANGLIHSVSGQIPFLPNIYEMLMDDSSFLDMGKYLFKYQKDSLDVLASIEAGIDENGETVFVDSVLIRKNDLLKTFGYINSEDSLYRMIAPTKAGWDAAYTKVSSYFNYAYITGSDSLKKYWTNHSLMKDLFFNWNLQKSPNDSIISTQYSNRTKDLHVFYNPFSAGGVLAGAEQVRVSNGLMYKVNTWPLDVEDVFFTPITVEAENDKNISALDPLLFNRYQRQKYADSISAYGYLEVSPVKSTDKTDVTFYIPNTLSGKYDICVVLLPKTINSSALDLKPNKFTARVDYKTVTGAAAYVSCKGKVGENKAFFENKPTKVDTITLTTLALPTCNYKQNKVTVTVRLQSIVTPKELTKYSHQMFIDCFYLKPRQD